MEFVILVENCAIHHVEYIAKSIQDVGAQVHFLPPYSPDFQPIEEAFSKVKTELKALEENYMNTNDTELLLLTSFASITPLDCKGWIFHSGIHNTTTSHSYFLANLVQELQITEW